MLRCKRKDSSVKIERDTPGGRNAFTGYGAGYVEVNGKRYGASLVVSAERLVTDWPATSVDSLGADHLAAILELKPEIAILGTGPTFRFPEPARLAPLHQARIGVEVMDTPAACRTYNILLGEGRNVVAALIVTPG
ncbi:MAG: Mth938-like domain-containing protein [Burkholderiales bacterium]|nr:Mth938-like domain-containing protein [Burkholderiales bacterium]